MGTAQVFTSNLGTNLDTGLDMPELLWVRPIASLMIIFKLELCIPVLAYPIFSDVKKSMLRNPLLSGLVTCRCRLLRFGWRMPFLALMGGCAALFGDQVALAVSLVGAVFGTPL